MVPGCNPKAVHPSKKAACHYQWEADTLYLSWSPNATCKLQLSLRKVTKWSNTHSDQKDKGFECKGHIAAAFRTSAQGVFGAVGDVEEAIVRLEPVVDLSRRPLKPTESLRCLNACRLAFGLQLAAAHLNRTNRSSDIISPVFTVVLRPVAVNR